MLRKSDFWLTILWAIVLCLLILQVNTGIADNGDFDRSVGWLLEKPVGFSSNTPPLGSPERGERYFSLWHPNWDYQATVQSAPYGMSSYQILLFLGWLVNKAIGLPHYSLIAAGLVSRIILLMTILFLAKYLFDRTWPFWAAVITFIFLDSRYIAFLNSFYQEHAAILFFLMLMLALVRFAKEGGRGNIVFLCLALFLFSTSKVQFVLTPIVLLTAWVISQGLGNRKARRIALLLAGMQLLASPLFLDNRFSERNHFNSFFSGALFFDRGYFPVWLKPELQECVGVPAWSISPDCFARLDTPIGLQQIGNAYVENPISLIKGIDFGLRNLNRIDLAREYSLETRTVVSFQHAGVVNLWNRVKRLGAGLPVYLELGCILALLFLIRKSAPHLSFIGLFLLSFILSQVAISILGEGSIDIEKHLLLANAALDLAAVISVFLLFRMIRDWAAKASPVPILENIQ